MKSARIESFAKVKNRFFFLLIGVFTIFLMYIFKPFFYPLFWAAVIAVMVYPIYARLVKLFRSPNVASLISVLGVFLGIVLPVMFIGVLIVSESWGLYNNANINPEEFKTLAYLDGTVFGPYAEQVKVVWGQYATQVTSTVGSFIVTKVTAATQHTLIFFGMLLLCLYSLFYFLKDGKNILTRLSVLSPLGDHYDRMLYNRFTDTVKVTLKSTVVLGTLQGFMGGILFAATGVPGALVWGVVMAAFSIIPAAGSFVVWVPAAIIEILIGNVWQGVTIFVVGACVISLVDNLLRPVFVGKAAELHPVVVLFATLGGLVLFGVSGFVIGPVLAALYFALLSVYEEYYRSELKKNL